MLNPSADKLGTETAFGVLARAGALAAKGRDMINLGIGQPDFRTPEHIVQAGIRALQDGAHGYTPSLGLPALREAVAADVTARYGVEPELNNIQIVPGGKPILFTAMMLLGGMDREILTPDPASRFISQRSIIQGQKQYPTG